MTAEVKLTIDLTNVEQRNLLNALFDLIGTNETTPNKKQEAKAEKAEKAETKTSKNEKAPAKAKGEDKPAAKASKIDINSVRALVSMKASSHRQALKAKLNELGAKNVTSLDPAKYGEFTEFLNAL